MSKKKVTEIVEELALPITSEEGLELVDVEYKKEGANWFLRVFIDKENGVDIDDCGRVSERLSDLLDELDPIPTSYFLEVSSPGAERPLKKTNDFLRAIGKQVLITTYEQLEGNKEFEGILRSYSTEALEIEVGNELLAIPVDKIASARMAIVF